ncbi:hypothetical protein CHS0354_008255 [Potamilus streckersoni]|uniref:Globin domain-containing protein n=1 Tax=Potamilus streckersoni TaxID=2493646 RepID=A0AAE0W8V5_9BIVA|nr:hypothetical protein CHS0354_008255 [Potamilus streckersoni]
MGNRFAVTCKFPREQRQLSACLNPQQIQLVQDSWSIINNDLPKLGVIVFLRFFEKEPELKTLFPKIIQMNNENKLEWEIDKEMLQKHAVTVMEGLGAAVESLHDSDFLNSVLISIGQTHIKRHVKPSMLRRLWPALNHGLQKTLQENYTKEVADAWNKVFTYICVYMKHGMEHPEIDFDSDGNTVLR